MLRFPTRARSDVQPPLMLATDATVARGERDAPIAPTFHSQKVT